MFVRFLHPANADVDMLSRLLGKLMLFNSLQSINAQLLIYVTPSPIITLANLLHPQKVFIPIPVTLFGIVMLVRLLQL